MFEASAYGLDPAKSGTENRTALQAAIDAACCAGGGTVLIPANGPYDIAGEIVIAPAPASTVTITSSGGRATLIQTEGAGSIFTAGSNTEANAMGHVVIKGMSIEGSFVPLEQP